MKSLSAQSALMIVLAAACLPGVARADMKARNKMTTGGMAIESTVYVKGSRQRTETNMGMAPGMQMINLHQCDLNRIVQINNNTCTYFISPTGTEGGENRAAAPTGDTDGNRRGGKVTIVTDVTDTGERQQMFGHTARHLRTRMTMKASPNACTPANTTMQTDGWYIDVAPSLDCAVKGMPARMPNPRSAGCQDDYIIKSTGSGRPGFPVKLTMNMDGGGGQATTITQETVELTSAALDQRLFDIPSNYREVHSMSELMGMGNMADMMSGRGGNSGCAGGAGMAPANAQPPSPGNGDSDNNGGGLRIGIAPVNNKTSASLSTEDVRGKIIELFDGMSSTKIEAVPLQSREMPDLDREARQKQCSYVLMTNVTALKEPSAKRKIGGFLGRYAGVPTSDGTYEASIDYQLYQVGKANSVLQSTASAKEGADAEASVVKAAEREVSLVLGLVRVQHPR